MRTALVQRLRAEADAVEAAARAHAHSLRATAAEIERDDSDDEWLSLDEAARLAGVRGGYVIRDAGRRGELEIGKAGRRRVVKRSDLGRWLAAKPMQPKKSDEEPPPESNARDLVAARVRARAARTGT